MSVTIESWLVCACFSQELPPSAHSCSQLPTQHSCLLALNAVTFPSGFPDSHLISSVFNAFKYEAEINCDQLLFKHLYYLPSCVSKHYKNHFFSSTSFYSLSQPVPPSPCSELAKHVSYSPTHRWLQHVPGQWCMTRIPAAGRGSWEQYIAALPSTLAVSTVLKCHCGSGWQFSSSLCFCQQVLLSSASK